MLTSRSFRPFRSALAASVALGALCIAPAYAGQILDALPADAQQDAAAVMQYAVAFDACPKEAYMDQANVYVLQLLAADVQGHPQFAELSEEGKRAMLFGLVRELQQESRNLPAPNCATDAPAARDAFMQRLAMRADQEAPSASREGADTEDNVDQDGLGGSAADQPAEIDRSSGGGMNNPRSTDSEPGPQQR